MTAIALTTGCGAAVRPRIDSFPADLATRVDAIVRSDIDAGLIPGAAVAISDPRHGTFTRAYGVDDVATRHPADAGDHFRIGSITKTFTATAVLRLVDAGELSADDRLSRYVDGIPHGDTITLRDLLGMRGGVYDYSTDPEFASQVRAKPADRAWSIDDALRVIRAHPEKAQPPKVRTVYSNSEFLLLGLVLEKVTGRPIGAVLDEVVAELGLHRTEYPADATMPVPSSAGYAYDGDVLTEVTARTTPSTFGAAGSMVSTIGDLAIYARALGRGALLKPETFRLRTQFTPMSGGEYGLGLMREGSWIGHGGAVLGYLTAVRYLPDRDVAIAVAINLNTPELTPVFPVNADFIWADLVAELYPGTVPGLTDGRGATPPVPSSAVLTEQLRQTLDPATPPTAKPLHVLGEERDPDLLIKVAHAFTHTTVTVDRVTDVGRGRMAAALTLRDPNTTAPMVMMFGDRDGAWRIADTGWMCPLLAAIGDQSAFCAAGS
ncbi:serine hydrolase domain-containing protein [Nocardia aurantia]|uniref:serine hydrolase domain-containing protein n=1 Tax=Nocardia aurantia TaxID=2585199 RepID=UPI00188618F1|nr:serine hydrolase domain-containing protein [Nocardia aurantia]